MKCLILIAVMSVITFAVASRVPAALPPLSKEQLKRADLIVLGTVTDIQTENRAFPNPWHGQKKVHERGYDPGPAANLRQVVNRHYLFTLRIDGVEQGSVRGSTKAVKVAGWNNWKRPRGWVGDGGHRVQGGRDLSDIQVGDQVRVYLTRGKNGAYNILAPNGLEIVPDSAETP